VSTTAVAGVPLGTAADEAERRLTSTLGKPVTDPLPGCYGETGRSLTWGRLTAYLSDGAEAGEVVLRGWAVTSVATGPDVKLPFETAVGDSVAEVRAKVPSSIGETATEGEFAGSYLIRTPRAPSLFWKAPSPTGLVTDVDYMAEGCD